MTIRSAAQERQDLNTWLQDLMVGPGLQGNIRRTQGLLLQELRTHAQEGDKLVLDAVITARETGEQGHYNGLYILLADRCESLVLRAARALLQKNDMSPATGVLTSQRVTTLVALAGAEGQVGGTTEDLLVELLSGGKGNTPTSTWVARVHRHLAEDKTVGTHEMEHLRRGNQGQLPGDLSIEDPIRHAREQGLTGESEEIYYHLIWDGTDPKEAAQAAQRLAGGTH